VLLLLFALCLVASSCSNDAPASGSSNRVGTGGTSGLLSGAGGGTATTSRTGGTGGGLPVGGTPGTGGSPATGGSPGTGGNPDSGVPRDSGADAGVPRDSRADADVPRDSRADADVPRDSGADADVPRDSRADASGPISCDGGASVTIEQALASLTVDQIQAELNYLTGDVVNGRECGSAGNALARTFIAKSFQDSRLLPMPDGSYIQKLSGANRGNVVGLLPGSDPTLKDQYIVIGAHHDCHYRGADDNASGTATVMAIARALALSACSLKRSVVFVTFDCEEVGFLGAGYYTSNAPYPIKQTIYMMNYDMVGHLAQSRLRFHNMGTSAPVKAIVNTVCQKRTPNVCSVQDSGGAINATDTARFVRAGVKSAYIEASNGQCYHQACDTIEKVDIPGVAKVAQIGAEIAYQLATQEGLVP